MKGFVVCQCIIDFSVNQKLVNIFHISKIMMRRLMFLAISLKYAKLLSV